MKIPSASAPPDVAPSEDKALAVLVRALRDSGEKAPLRDGWAILTNGLLLGRPLVTDLGDDHVRRIQLLVPSVVPLGERRNMYPVAVGEGSSYDGALADASATWINSVMPMLREAMANTCEPPSGGGFQVDVAPAGRITLMRVPSSEAVQKFALARKPGAGTMFDHWKVFCGAIALQGTREACDSLDEHLSHLPPLTVLLRCLHHSLRTGAVHWLQLIVTRQPDQSMILSCFLDNQPCADGRAALIEAYQGLFPWPVSEQACGFRQYVVLRPDSEKDLQSMADI